MKVNIKINRDKELNSKSEENIRKIKCYGDGKVKKMHVSERVLEVTFYTLLILHVYQIIKVTL